MLISLAILTQLKSAVDGETEIDSSTYSACIQYGASSLRMRCVTW